MIAALIATWLIAVTGCVGCLWLWLRLAETRQILQSIVQRFADAGIDVAVTGPLQTDVRLPETWQDDGESEVAAE